MHPLEWKRVHCPISNSKVEPMNLECYCLYCWHSNYCYFSTTSCANFLLIAFESVAACSHESMFLIALLIAHLMCFLILASEHS